jgi:hypothetical protein
MFGKIAGRFGSFYRTVPQGCSECTTHGHTNHVGVTLMSQYSFLVQVVLLSLSAKVS